MKQKNLLFIFLFFLANTAFAVASYNVYTPDKYQKAELNPDEETLFIMDFSNSMNDMLGDESKANMMIATMQQILPTINPKNKVGLRIYGQRSGFTLIDACKASTLAVPIAQNSAKLIQEKLERTIPKGMTPITYSLKKSLAYDFAGFNGKKHIILLSDGGENCDESPCKWAMNVIRFRHDINIDVIAFNVDNQDDIDQLKCTALVTSGKFYKAKTSADLIKSMQNSLNIKKDVDAKIIMH